MSDLASSADLFSKGSMHNRDFNMLDWDTLGRASECFTKDMVVLCQVGCAHATRCPFASGAPLKQMMCLLKLLLEEHSESCEMANLAQVL